MTRPVIASGDDDDLCVVRQARKRYRCWALPQHRDAACLQLIEPGTFYVEYFGEAPGYQSGQRFCLACAPRNLGITFAEPS